MQPQQQQQYPPQYPGQPPQQYPQQYPGQLPPQYPGQPQQQPQYPGQQGPPTVIYVTSPTPVVAPAPIQANTRWRNRPQTNATAAAGFIFVSGGANLALSVGWTEGSIFGSTEHFLYSWFIAVIIGTVLSIPLRHFVTKKIIMAISALLILISGIIFASDPLYYDSLMAARYLNGIAIGLATIPFLMNASEIADVQYRGVCVSLEQYSFSLGIAIQMIYASNWTQTEDFPANRLHGILDIFWAVIAGIYLVAEIESPVDLIRKGNEAAALETLGRLRRPQGVTTETQLLLNEYKTYVREEESLTFAQSLQRGLVPLVKILFFRSMMLVFCISIPLNMSIQYSSLATYSIWVPTVSGVFRVLGGIFAMGMVDNSNRKIPSIFSMLIVGCFIIGLGSLFMPISNITNYDDMNSAMYLYLFLQLFAGFFVPYTSVYASEAFPLKAKPILLATVIIVEQILHIILITTLTVHIGDNLMTQGIIAVVAFLALAVSMPETRYTSLTEAQLRFRKLINL
ncbi:glucose transporter GlcP-like [Musca autumnalis]|uniref:glucose transporter GlcP-like n=1 Tax=Musca autumnalis TaxID=221902 RepID=UPI003CF4AE5B